MCSCFCLVKFCGGGNYTRGHVKRFMLTPTDSKAALRKRGTGINQNLKNRFFVLFSDGLFMYCKQHHVDNIDNMHFTHPRPGGCLSARLFRFLLLCAFTKALLFPISRWLGSPTLFCYRVCLTQNLKLAYRAYAPHHHTPHTANVTTAVALLGVEGLVRCNGVVQRAVTYETPLKNFVLPAGVPSLSKSKSTPPLITRSRKRLSCVPCFCGLSWGGCIECDEAYICRRGLTL